MAKWLRLRPDGWVFTLRRWLEMLAASASSLLPIATSVVYQINRRRCSMGRYRSFLFLPFARYSVCTRVSDCAKSLCSMIEKQLKDANKPVATLSWMLAYTLMVLVLPKIQNSPGKTFSCHFWYGINYATRIN